MTRIADLSRYDGPDVHTVDQYDGAYFNVADPWYRDKVAYCVDGADHWGPYAWLYPGQGAACADTLAAAVHDHSFPSPPMGYAIDYEQAGVSQTDLINCLDRGEQLGIFDRMIVYTYLYIVGSIANVMRGRPLWIAYYPGANDGSYDPSYSTAARTWGAILHQFTSGGLPGGGSRDLSEVVDETAWAQWTSARSTPPVTRKVTDMTWIVEKRDNQPDQWWEPVEGGCLQLTGAEAFGYLAAGVPHVEWSTYQLIGYAQRRRQHLLTALA